MCVQKRAFLENNILMRFSYGRPLALSRLKSLPTKSLVGLATFYRKTLNTRATLHCLPSRAATTHLCPERLVSYIYSIARCYRVSSFSMDASANAGHELLSFINASPTRESTFQRHPWRSLTLFQLSTQSTQSRKDSTKQDSAVYE